MTPSLPQRNADRDDFIVQGRVDHVCSWRDSFMCVEDSFMCDMTRSCVWRDPFVSETRIIGVWDTNVHVWLIVYVWRDPFVSETRIIGVWDSNVHVWLIDVRDMTQSHVRHDSCVMMTHPCVWRDLFICALYGWKVAQY